MLKFRKLNSMEVTLLIIIIMYIFIVSIKNPQFLAFENLYDLMRITSSTFILSAGVLVVLISGGIDVSFTAIAVVSGYSSILLAMKLGIDNIFFIITLSGFIGMLLGNINSFLISKLKLSTFIVTLATSNVFYGFMTVFIGTKSITVSEKPKALVLFSSAKIFGIPLFFVIAIMILFITYVILNKTRLGKKIYAIGNDEVAAFRIGINITRVKSFIYSYIGVLSGICGVVYFSEIDLINPISLVGSELMVIAAVIIGGVRLTGGEGTVLGAILGVIIIQLFKSTLILLGLSSSMNDLFIGTILLVSIGVMAYKQRKDNRKKLIFM